MIKLKNEVEPLVELNLVMTKEEAEQLGQGIKNFRALASAVEDGRCDETTIDTFDDIEFCHYQRMEELQKILEKVIR